MLEKILFLEDSEEIAHRMLPPESWNYLMAYTERGQTFTNNHQAYGRYKVIGLYMYKVVYKSYTDERVCWFTSQY